MILELHFLLLIFFLQWQFFLELLEKYRDFLNKNLIPYVPKEGSVGYLCAEAHIASVLLGEGKAWFDGELLSLLPQGKNSAFWTDTGYSEEGS